MESYGAGEILLTSMDCDGTKNGYDIPLTRAISDRVDVITSYSIHYTKLYEPFRPLDPEPLFALRDRDPGFLELDSEGVEVRRHHVADQDVAAGDCRRGHVGAGLDP